MLKYKKVKKNQKCAAEAPTIEPPKLQASIAQTQQYKPILTAFLSCLLFTLL